MKTIQFALATFQLLLHCYSLNISQKPVKDLGRLSTETLERKSPRLFTEVELVGNWGKRNTQSPVLKIMKTHVEGLTEERAFPFSVFTI